jgi:hypothetical protein
VNDRACTSDGCPIAMEVRAANVREGAFTAHATKFFVGLERDNSKDYWTANKAIFENEVKEPMAALVGTVYLRASGRARIDGGLRRVHDDARSAGAVWEAVAADGTGRALEDQDGASRISERSSPRGSAAAEGGECASQIVRNSVAGRRDRTTIRCRYLRRVRTDE